ncbi:hypothetical protein K402DRAFT_397828 [Aulographum hederae CBS 113979]|uniref:Uncharacterized protein n=1 Tax=Aulographum hederae CBS 113979 TaxID=1176131 RepID=A0A6G1GMZ3_9PEZI|nr:hypothetical protein K402DRAFT_397828 [Aulographum hederae CBS 113979]
MAWSMSRYLKLPFNAAMRTDKTTTSILCRRPRHRNRNHKPKSPPHPIIIIFHPIRLRLLTITFALRHFGNSPLPSTTSPTLSCTNPPTRHHPHNDETEHISVTSPHLSTPSPCPDPDGQYRTTRMTRGSNPQHVHHIHCWKASILCLNLPILSLAGRWMNVGKGGFEQT